MQLCKIHMMILERNIEEHPDHVQPRSTAHMPAELAKERLHTDELVLERKGQQFRKETLAIKSSQIISTLHGK